MKWHVRKLLPIYIVSVTGSYEKVMQLVAEVYILYGKRSSNQLPNLHAVLLATNLDGRL